MRKAFLVICIVLVLCHKSHCVAQDELLVDPVDFSKDGAWCWFQDPRSVYVEGDRERIYAQWVTSCGELEVGAYDLISGDVETFVFKENWGANDHNVGAFLVLPDRRLIVFYAQHNKQGLFCKTSMYPEDISSWSEEIIISDDNHVTYAHPVYLAKEKRFYVFWRGSSWKPTFSTSRDGIHWSTPQIFIQDNGREKNDIRPYLKVATDGVSSIHFAFTDGHPRVERENSIYYIRYTGGYFFTANGSHVGSIDYLPVQHGISDVVYDGKKYGARSWVWDIALDKDQFPVIVYVRYPQDDDHRYHYARWDGFEWFDTQLSKAGGWYPQTPEGIEEVEKHYSGGISLDSSDPSRVYLSRERKGIFEIERWTSPDEGKVWFYDSVTMNSRHHNARPIVPRGFCGEKSIVLWMSGDYISYLNFNCRIKLLLHPEY